jgi:hypothetical protein
MSSMCLPERHWVVQAPVNVGLTVKPGVPRFDVQRRPAAGLMIVSSRKAEGFSPARHPRAILLRESGREVG